MEEKILGKQKDTCPTVLYEKIKRQSTFKGLKSPMYKIFADLKEMKNTNITISLKNIQGKAQLYGYFCDSKKDLFCSFGEIFSYF